MCGIAGLLYFDPQRAVDAGLLDRMTDVLAHRGPDGRGTHRDGPLGLGHRRLAIIDLSPDGAQPMTNEDGTVWVALNGEIYNFQELRPQLEAKGHRFSSKSDTEVLVHGWEEWGERLVDRLRGMFAFAVWDARARRLFLARDRFGKKPLFYRLSEDGLWFGSEAKAILQDPAVPRVPDRLALHEYLTYGYVPGPRSAFEGIKKLPPAHTLTVEQDGRHRLAAYWALQLAPKHEGLGSSEADLRRAGERVSELLDEATRLRMISDVPLGAFLSGGVDSSAVVAAMCRQSPRGAAGVRTFAIGFQEPEFDESGWAERVARHLGTDHRVLMLTPDGAAGLSRIAWHYGEPFADASCIPTFAVSALARRHVTVALSGDGGDELFCGYKRHVGTRLREKLQESHPWLRGALENRVLIEALRRAGRTTLAVELSHGRWQGDIPPSDLYMTRVEHISPALKAELYADPLLLLTRGRDARERVRLAIAASRGETFTERCAHADAVTYLPDDILVKVDIASMAHGLETRAPLLDHVLAEYVARLPFALKMQRLVTKRALKRAIRDRVPGEVLTREKMGFGVPLEHWFRGGFRSLLQEVLLDPRALGRGLFRPEAVERLVSDHAAGRADHQNPLFVLLMLELWFRLWIDPPAGSALPAPAEEALAVA